MITRTKGDKWPWSIMFLVFGLALLTEGLMHHAVLASYSPSQYDRNVYGVGLYGQGQFAADPTTTTTALPQSTTIVALPPEPQREYTTPTSTTSTTTTTTTTTEPPPAIHAPQLYQSPDDPKTGSSDSGSHPSTWRSIARFVIDPLHPLVQKLDRQIPVDVKFRDVVIKFAGALSHATFPLLLAFFVGLFLRHLRDFDRGEKKLEEAPMFVDERVVFEKEKD